MKSPIGVYDSGLGGLTVLRALRARLPAEDYLYFADTRYLPYGDRTETFLRERGLAVARAMAAKGVKALVIACNTATAAAAEAIRSQVDVPVVALEPAVKPAVALSRNGIIGVFATTRTIESPRFRRLVDDHARAVTVLAQACPGLAETIEIHGAGSSEVGVLLDRYVRPVREAGADTIVLGCTHYPFVAADIAARLPDGAVIVDTGEAVARQLERVLLAHALQGGGKELVRLATSGAPAMVHEKAARLWGERLMVEHWDW